MKTPLNLFSKFLCAILLVLLGSQASYASHAVGADLTYICIDPATNTYEITLHLYRDCDGVAAPAAVNINFDGGPGCPNVPALNINQTSSQEVSQVCPGTTTACAGGATQGIEEYTYTSTIILPAGCDSYTLSYSLCCRNNAITNLQAPSSQDLYVETTINTLLAPCNSSPQFSNVPVLYTCAGQQTFYNHGFSDPDGDSLVFTLVNPHDNATTPINFVAGLSATNPLVTDPPNSFQFNSSNGQMIFTPDLATGSQVAVISVRVDEYRNGVLIGSIVRDLQVVVMNNCTNNASSLDTLILSTGLVNGNIIEVCGGNTLNFDVEISDPDIADVLTVTSDIDDPVNGIPGATYVVTGTNPVTVTFDVPTSTLPTGSYPFTITINDNACPIPSNQIIGYELLISNLIARADNYFICDNELDTIQFFADGFGGVGAPGTYAWTSLNGSPISDPTIFNPFSYMVQPDTLVVTYTDGALCRD